MQKIYWSLCLVFMFIPLAACAAAAGSKDIEPTPILDESVTGLPGQVTEPTKEVESPTDANLVRGNVFISSTELLILESFPIQVMLAITGELPTPCDTFAHSIEAPDEQNQIHVEVYSLSEPGVVCVQVLQPFEENLSISSLTTPLEDGSYTVWVNGELVGEFAYPGG